MKKILFAICSILISGCSSTPILTSQPIEVDIKDLGQFWENSAKSFSFRSPGNIANRPAGYVKIRYLIDSNGEVFEPTVVESQPAGVWDDQGLRAVREMEYKPSSENSSKDPVYVTTAFHFDMGA